MYVWFLGLSAKWTLKLKVGLKLRWIYFCLVIAIAFVNALVSHAIGRTGSVVLGLVAQIAFGAWFFGKFAVRSESRSAQFLSGLKIVGTATALMLVVIGSIFMVTSLVLPRATGG
jgi:hypothetical protein